MDYKYWPKETKKVMEMLGPQLTPFERQFMNTVLEMQLLSIAKDTKESFNHNLARLQIFMFAIMDDLELLTTEERGQLQNMFSKMMNAKQPREAQQGPRKITPIVPPKDSGDDSWLRSMLDQFPKNPPSQ